MTHLVSKILKMKPAQILTAILFATSLTSATMASLPQDNTVFRDLKHKFALSAGATNWTFIETPKQLDGLLFLARGPKNPAQGSAPTLSLRVDSSEYKSAKAYADHWLREYPKYGFQVEFARPTTLGGINAYELQVQSLDVQKTVHQIVLTQDKDMFVFTCTTVTQSATDSLNSCKKITESLKRF